MTGHQAGCLCSLSSFVEVGLHPVLVSFDGEGPDQAPAAFGVGEDAHDIGPSPDHVVETFEYVGQLHVLVALAAGSR